MQRRLNEKREERNLSILQIENPFLSERALDTYKTISSVSHRNGDDRKKYRPNTSSFYRCLNFQPYVRIVFFPRFSPFIYPLSAVFLSISLVVLRLLSPPVIHLENRSSDEKQKGTIPKTEQETRRSDRNGNTGGLHRPCSSVCNLESGLQPTSSRSEVSVCSISSSLFLAAGLILRTCNVMSYPYRITRVSRIRD